MDTEGKKPEHINEILFRLLNGQPPVNNVAAPPYESPIEDIFAEHCFKYLSEDVLAEKQTEVTTKHGNFRVDFELKTSMTRIAIECDGKEFHNLFKDEIRDSILLGEKHFDTIYHFRGSDLNYYPYDCIWLMFILDKSIFNKRAHLQLVKLRENIFEISTEKANTEDHFLFNIEPPNLFFRAFRRSLKLETNNPHLRYYWRTLYEFACEYPNASLDELLSIRTSDIKKMMSEYNH
jgi:hypothetical protein